MRMKQYIQMVDYSLWEVIENGNAPLITKVVEGVETIIAPTTVKDKAQKRDGFKMADGYANNEGKEILEEDLKEVFCKWVLRNQENMNRENTRRVMPVETTTSNALISYDGAGYDWRNFIPPKLNFSFTGLEEFVDEPRVSEPTVKKHVVETSEAKASEAKYKAVRNGHLGKFDGKADEGFFVGYSINSKAFKVFNSRTKIVEENMHVRFRTKACDDAGDGDKKVTEEPRKEGGFEDPDFPDRVYKVEKALYGLHQAPRICVRDLQHLASEPRVDRDCICEKEAIHLILTGIGDDIYSTVDACQTTQEMWEAIERLQQGKEIAKPITPPSETAFEEDSDLEQAQKDKDMQKNSALIPKYFQKIYKPTNNNIRTSSNSKNKNVDTTPRFKNDSQSGMFRNQRTECRKPKRVKDSAYHKEKMLLCKQAEQGVSLQAELYDWLEDMDEDVDEQELEAHYSYMAKIQEVPTADSGTDSEPVEHIQDTAGYNVFANHPQHSEQSESNRNTCLVETDDSNVTPDSPDMCEDDIQNEQNDVESDDERVALANLISNLKLNVDESKKIQKQLKKANTTLAQELKQCKVILTETSKSLRKSISVRDSCLVALQTKQTEFEKYKAFNDRTIDYDKLERKLNEALGQLAHTHTVIKEGLKTKAYVLLVVKEKHDELMKLSLLTKSHYEGLVKQKTKNKPVDENLIDLNKPVDENLLDLNNPVDENLLDLNKPVDEKLLDLNKPVDENLLDLNKPVDEKRKRSLVEDSYEFCAI
uniref:Ribonuclease H-like domain-containing protein n=1 Tax=Tanacetum cinerariifolium TaxID=118510 RepID=A0A6L2K2T0_TANCI|nr:ribonuclease H-like domain-containing protein [Tanacetum cinerariifolium]